MLGITENAIGKDQQMLRFRQSLGSVAAFHRGDLGFCRLTSSAGDKFRTRPAIDFHHMVLRLEIGCLACHLGCILASSAEIQCKVNG